MRRAALVMWAVAGCGWGEPDLTNQKALSLAGSDAGVGDAPVSTTTSGSVQFPPDPPPQKFLLCHKTDNPRHAVTIEVPAAALPDHIAAGDMLGGCAFPAPTAESRLQGWTQDATAISVIVVDSMTSRTVTGPTPVVTDVALHTVTNFVGTAPSTVTKRGGTLPDGIAVRDSEEPYLEPNSTYLGFFYPASTGVHLGVVVPTDGTSIILQGETLSLTRVRIIVSH